MADHRHRHNPQNSSTSRLLVQHRRATTAGPAGPNASSTGSIANWWLASKKPIDKRDRSDVMVVLMFWTIWKECSRWVPGCLTVLQPWLPFLRKGLERKLIIGSWQASIG
ncbi:ARP protein (REF) [Zea mays]|uniref:ARP protein (REF) n=1 Tax=Zea mays TaxID=4577 RepID=A0A1D6I5Y7_MAIZE|nr:ARP protein (REF) [Zea mays]